MPQLSPNTNSFALRSSLFALLFPIVACHSQPDCNTALDQAMARLQKRDDWTERPVQQLPRHPAEKFLRGWVIVLDPGHGGAAHRRGYKRGPSGVREAEINLRVALLVERLLADAGAFGQQDLDRIAHGIDQRKDDDADAEQQEDRKDQTADDELGDQQAKALPLPRGATAHLRSNDFRGFSCSQVGMRRPLRSNSK